MSCRRVARQLQAWLDGEADGPTAQLVAAHVEDCRRCGLEADVYRAVKGALARRESPDALTLARLRAFGAALLAEGTPGNETPGPWNER